jgi:NADH dehydrogenase FAD-containing subunit
MAGRWRLPVALTAFEVFSADHTQAFVLLLLAGIAFAFHDKGFVVSVGTRRGVADIAGVTTGGQLAHLLKDAIEWEYRQSVTHLRGWDPIAR